METKDHLSKTLEALPLYKFAGICAQYLLEPKDARKSELRPSLLVI